MLYNIFLFTIIIICWSPTWYAIKFQLGVVDPVLAVSYRFIIASVILFCILKITNRKVIFSLKHDVWFFLLGINLFK